MDMGAMSSASSSMSSGMDMMSSMLSSMQSQISSMSMAVSNAASATATATGDSGMDMGHMMGTASASAAMASSTGGGMSMGGSGSTCKISMLWNWYTIDACFISRSWHVTTRGMFAGSCIGVFAWILALEALKRGHREFDRWIIRTRRTSSCCDGDEKTMGPPKPVFPNFWQQAVRAAFYTIEFGAAYLLMLMAMYYNGYIMITMWISAFIAYFLLNNEPLGADSEGLCC